MTHYFYPPNTFRPVNPKHIPGERARKKCREWNKLLKKRNQAKMNGDFALVRELEEKLSNF